MNQNHEPNYDYEEIDLRDIFKTLNKWKNTIISVTLIAMLLSGVISFFFLTPIYEAKTDLMQTSSQILNGDLRTPNYILKDEEEFRKVEESALNIKTPVIDLTSYNELAYSTIILKNTIEKLDLDIRARELRKMINTEKPKDQANVQITVTDKDPELAAQIANTLAGELIIYINETEQKNFKKVIETLDIQIDNAQKDLNKAVDNLKEYRANNLNTSEQVDLVRQELEEKKLQNEINRREDLIDFLNTKMLELKITQAFMDTEDKIIILSEAYIPDNPIKPNKKLNIAIASVLALMLSVFGVFLVEYLREEEEVN
ncbi:MAG TPA: Wzz/FepE/Etk N-terminal domain-containing protein [Syntrophomonadaceae bacterium]|nr:Wzz/FepE/Etk N-terminal domain-containing protein [Syntrophomonadaceae bacterium]